jgi:hypothetical protein
MTKKSKVARENRRVWYPTGPSLTKQAFKDEVNINNIVARYTPDMQGPPLSEKNFGDFSDVPDLHGLYERMENAKESFYQLPSKVRMKFANDPLAFMEFASDESNLDEMREMGLAHPKQEENPSVSTPEEREA